MSFGKCGGPSQGFGIAGRKREVPAEQSPDNFWTLASSADSRLPGATFVRPPASFGQLWSSQGSQGYLFWACLGQRFGNLRGVCHNRPFRRRRHHRDAVQTPLVAKRVKSEDVLFDASARNSAMSAKRGRSLGKVYNKKQQVPAAHGVGGEHRESACSVLVTALRLDVPLYPIVLPSVYISTGGEAT